jgi:hypothetical protein
MDGGDEGTAYMDIGVPDGGDWRARLPPMTRKRVVIANNIQK